MTEQVMERLKETKGVLDFTDPILSDLNSISVDNIHVFYFRDLYIKKYGFLLLNNKFLDKLADLIREVSEKENPTILEIGAGYGALSYHLRKRGINCIVNDCNINKNEYFETLYDKAMIPLEEYNTEPADKAICDINGIDLVLSSWAPFQNSMLVDALKELRKKDLKLIAITEGDGGCVADDEFFAKAKDISYEYNNIEEVNTAMYNFYGIHDRVDVYK